MKNRHAIPKYILKRKKDEREKPLLFNLVKVVRFLISPKKKKEEIEENKIIKFLENKRGP